MITQTWLTARNVARLAALAMVGSLVACGVEQTSAKEEVDAAQARQALSDGYCIILLNSCPAHPANAYTSFYDKNNLPTGNPAHGSDYSAYYCNLRLADYVNWCQTTQSLSMDFITIHDWFVQHASSSVNTTPISNPTSTACKVSVSDCPNHPSDAFTTQNDNYDGAGSNESVCMGRAHDYVAWCGASYPIVASFYMNNRLWDTTTADPKPPAGLWSP